MTNQTWSRKENAIKAVNKLMVAAGVDYPSSTIEALESSLGGFFVNVYAKASHSKATAEALKDKAFVYVDGAEEQPTEEAQPEPVAEVAPTEEPAKKVNKKRSRKLFIDGDKNPFRAGNGAWKTFEHVRANPGIEFEAIKEVNGVRMRAVSHCLQMGWFKVGE